MVTEMVLQSIQCYCLQQVITTMVMSIISAVFTVGVVTQTAIGVAQDSYSCKLYYSYYTYRHCDADVRILHLHSSGQVFMYKM